MIWPLLGPVVKRIPPIVWAFLFAFALGLGGLALAYHHGRTVERHQIDRRARQDSIRAAVIVARDRRAHTDSVRTMARIATKAAERERPHRQALRDTVQTLMPTLPVPVVHLLEADDALLRRDSIALEAHLAAESQWVAERLATDTVIALQARQIVAVSRAADGGHPARHLVLVGTVMTVVGLVLGVLAHR